MGRYWAYFDGDKRITDRDEIDRLNGIALPPAYGDAWFCADANGHLQATGIDARGRKQYRYHADFRAKRDNAKYEGLLEFGKALPRLRRRVERDLKRRKLGRETVLAAVVRLLDTEHIRIGNEEYAKANKSFGATTLRSRHMKRKGAKLTMRFVGKHGIVHEATHHRQQPEARRQALPGAAGPDAVPICQRRRRAAGDHLERRQRLYPRSNRAASSPPSTSAPGARA